MQVVGGKDVRYEEGVGEAQKGVIGLGYGSDGGGRGRLAAAGVSTGLWAGIGEMGIPDGRVEDIGGELHGHADDGGGGRGHCSGQAGIVFRRRRG